MPTYTEVAMGSFRLILLLNFFAVVFFASAQSGNDDCQDATPLTVNAACTSGTTDGNSTEFQELSPSCMSSTFTETVWYKFQATASNMYVQLYSTSFSGNGATWGPSYWVSTVYNTISCQPTASNVVSCVNSNTQGSGDKIMTNYLTGLTAGQWYSIQIGYRTGAGVNLVPNFCIKVGDVFTPVCNTCSSNCGPACGFTNDPSVNDVVTNCPDYGEFPYLEGSASDTQCYYFTASNDTVDFQVIVNSTCGSGNVTNFTWKLYNISCGSAIQSGDLTDLEFTGLTIGQKYVYCYTYTVPSNCYHTTYWPYFIGATPLPVTLLSFTGNAEDNRVRLRWETASEMNNDYFLLQRSKDGVSFNDIGIVPGAGNSSTIRYYELDDMNPFESINYYRLLQRDFDGTTHMYNPIAVLGEGDELISISLGGENVNLNYRSGRNKSVEITILDQTGRKLSSRQWNVQRGENALALDYPESYGMYFVEIYSSNSIRHLAFIK